MPPSDVRLSDALVVLVLSAAIPGRQCGSRWPADFDSAGDIKPARWPMGETVILWAFGLPFLPVYADYYMLTGSTWRSFLFVSFTLLFCLNPTFGIPTHSFRFDTLNRRLFSMLVRNTTNGCHGSINLG